MAKVKVRGTDKAATNLAKRVVGAIAGDPALKNITKNFQKTLRSGKLLDGQNIKELKASTISRRRKLAKVNRTGKSFAPAKSNLTFSGQFINSFVTSISRIKNVVILKISPSGIHKGYTNLNGTRQKGMTNEKLGELLIDGGRDYRKIGELKQKEIRNIVVNIIKRALRRS